LIVDVCDLAAGSVLDAGLSRRPVLGGECDQVAFTEPVRMNVKSRSALHGIVQQFVVGVGDDVLKRRRLGLCLPRCLPL
jgi:hypothetical protein